MSNKVNQSTQTLRQPTVAVIIVSWNNKNILADCINSVTAQTYRGAEVYLVDNDSHDGTPAYIEKKFPAVHLIKNNANDGFAKGNNIGFRHALADAKYDYFVLLNSDARLAVTWIEELVAFAQMKPTGALFQGVTLDYYDHSVIDSTHIYVSKNGQGTQGNWRKPLTGHIVPMRVFGVNAAACMISRAFIEAQPFADVFDERMFMYLEDVDLSARATIMGWDNYLVPSAVAYHMGSVSSGKNPGFSLYMTFRNNSAMLIKNFPIPILIKILPKLIHGDILTIRHLRRLGRRDAAWKVFKGRIVGLLLLSRYFSDAKKLAKLRAIDNKYLDDLLETGYL